MTDRSIIVGVDGTSTALRAVAWAAQEALLRGRPLRLVHAAPYLGTRTTPRAAVAQTPYSPEPAPSPTRSRPS
jgi:nucleotide-binding universal stress UspA family protein